MRVFEKPASLLHQMFTPDISLDMVCAILRKHSLMKADVGCVLNIDSHKHSNGKNAFVIVISITHASILKKPASLLYQMFTHDISLLRRYESVTPFHQMKTTRPRSLNLNVETARVRNRSS